MGILRRLRSILKTGILWVIFWVPVSLLLSAGFVVAGALTYSVITVLQLALVYAVTGFITGCAFGAVMSVAEARKTLSRLRRWRVGLWGALAALAFPAVSLVLTGWSIPSIALFVFNLAATALAGAGCAVGMVGMARHADRLQPPDQPPLLPSQP